MKYWPCSRLPCRRPCMSVKATMTVSTSPASTAARSWSTVNSGGPPWCIELGMVSPSCRWLSEKSTQERGRGVAVLLHGRAGSVGVTGEDGRDHGVVLLVGVLDVDAQHGDLAEQLSERGLR